MAKKLEGAQVEEMKVKEPVNQQIHRMCLLRVKLMHFVNSLHNYITTRVSTHNINVLMSQDISGFYCLHVENVCFVLFV